VLIHLTDEARTIVDRGLPAAHAAITATVADLSEHDRERLIIAYTAGAEDALQRAADRNWTITSTKADWATIFPAI
jgi:hypothetical protein